MRPIRIMLCAGLLLLCAGGARAQEVQVPLDQAGRIETVDARLAQRLGLLADRYPGFREARLFQAPDSSFVLEVTTVREGRLQRQRVPLSRAEAADLRRQVSERVAARAPAAGMDQGGRSTLLGQTALLGFAFYGPALPYVLGTDDPSTATGLYLLTSGASFFVPYLLTQDQPVSRSMATLSGYGASRGIAHGFLLYRLLAGDRDESYVIYEGGADGYDYRDEENDERAAAGTAMALSVAEGIGGYLWARDERFTPGTAVAVSTGGDFGLAGGLALSYLLGADDIGVRSASAFGLAGAGAGVLGGRWIAARRNYTAGDASVIYTTGLIGALSGLAAADLANLRGRGLVTGGMVGAGTGLYLGDRLVRGTDLTLGQASLTALGTTAGALAGLGAGILVGGDDVDETIPLVGSALGSVAGFALTYRALAPGLQPDPGEVASSWKVRVDPRGVVGLARGGLADQSRRPTPIFSVERRF